ncbi:MAG: pyruvate dehydrogenase (acetyl-transferring) E1 component subunit alpha [Thermoleophilia bacterium]|nr:pyruvate dehydrogenase (acetyl-transferring) E1 component subunit alpha [Thermoleophilia bacterium]
MPSQTDPLEHRGPPAPTRHASGEEEPGQLIALFRAMVAARAFDERAFHLQRTGRLPAYYQCSGMEAAAGVAFALREQDWIFSAYREQPIRLARGVPVVCELALWKGAVDRVWDPVEHRITPLNATIGTHITHAAGYAHAARLRGRDEVAVAVFGDGATSVSDFHAGLNFAGVWRAPVVFVCLNNLYAQSTPVTRQTAAATLAQKADAYGLPGVRVDGMDALAVRDAVRAAVERAAGGGGPTLVETLMYRYAPHSTYDGRPAYRTREEEEEWKGRDPIDRMRRLLEERGLLEAGLEEATRQEVAASVDEAIEALEAGELPPRSVPFRHVYAAMPSHLADQLREAEPDGSDATAPAEAEQASERRPAPGAGTASMTLVEAVNAALRHALEHDDRVVLLGEDVGLEGGVFRVTEGLYERFGGERVIDTPLSETGILGTAVGMAMAGLRPVPELEFAGFMNTAFDQIVFHAARYRWRTRGVITTPMVIRMPTGGGHEGYEGHSDSPEALFVHTPGLVVVYPSNPFDAKGLLAAALEADDPIVFFEPIAQYFVKHDGVPVDHYTIPLGRARTVRDGHDATIVAYGNAVNTGLAAVDLLAAGGVSVELIDLRTLKPWDEEAVLESVAKTGRLVVCHEAPTIGGVGAEIAAVVAEKGSYLLETPPVRVGHPDMPWGQALLERYSLLEPERIAVAVRRTLDG